MKFVGQNLFSPIQKQSTVDIDVQFWKISFELFRKWLWGGVCLNLPYNIGLNGKNLKLKFLSIPVLFRGTVNVLLIPHISSTKTAATSCHHYK